MRYYKFVLIAVMLFGLTTTITAKDAYKAVKVYMFGFSASFNDSTVNFTDIQAVDAYVENNHTHFLVNRDEYSYQLRYYMESIQPDSNPTCLPERSEGYNLDSSFRCTSLRKTQQSCLPEN